MRRTRTLALLWLALLAPGATFARPADDAAPVAAEDAEATASADAGRRYAIVGGKVVTITGEALDGGMVLTRGAKIENVLDATTADAGAPEGYEVVDATGLWVVPGFVDLHSHVGGPDLNDMVYPTNQGLRTLDNIQPENRLLSKAQAGGVTTVLFIPGSGTNMGGFGTIMKTAGTTHEEIVVRFPGALKIAQGGNPERRGGDIGYSRVGMNWIIRRALREGKEYSEAWDAWEKGEREEKPVENPRLEMFRGLFKREFPVLVHTQGYHLIHSTIRILHDEMKLWVVIGHGTFDGPRMAPEVAERGIMVMNGPRQLRFDSETGSLVGLAHEWHEGGIHDVGVNTDSGVVPQHDLFYQAAMAARLGLDDGEALRGITIEGARALGVDDRVGSIEAGKDADLVLWTGNPLDPRSSVKVTMVNGRIVYDTSREPRRF